jgi:hypothetical protein
MNQCPDTMLLQRYFDRELTRAQRRELAPHVRSCAACRQVMRGFAGVRRAVRGIPLPQTTHIALARARQEVARLRQIELIGWLRRWTAAAAAVLVISMVVPMLLSHPVGGGNGVDAGELSQPADASLAPGYSVAQWIVRDLTLGS